MRISKLFARRVVRGVAGAVVAAVATGTALSGAPLAAASAQSFCGELGGNFDGLYCRTVVSSPRKADRDIKVAIPEFVDSNPEVHEYLRNLYNNWKAKGSDMIQDSYGEENFQVFNHGSTTSIVFHEDYHANGPQVNNAYRTFNYDGGKRIMLKDILKGGDLGAIPPIAEPFIIEALDRSAPGHTPQTYPFTPDRWTPDKVYSGAYKAWALTPDELIIYMPDYPVAHDYPIDYSPGQRVYSMDGGSVEAHIPIGAIAPILRPGYGG
ncbi:RsiV family protein [Mycobacterium sp. NPDC050853]|uniref:RsiV family protein n=1 Tax=Mycobacterium sp. NPDC050853 TaxID=3155160 RepID=UPI0033E6BF34